jgi:NitT/TauT family transport system substrate-binding protein
MRLFISSVTAIAMAPAMELACPRMAQEKANISIARQPGILYLPSQMLETRKLIEKQAAKEGLDGVAVEWRTRRC